MKKLMSLLCLLALASPAHARSPENAPLHGYVCQLEGEMKGLRLGFGIGAQFLGGKGVISCIAPRTGRHYHLPVKFRLLGAGAGFDLNWVRNVRLVTAGFGVVASPYDLTGQYAVGAGTGITFVNRGVGVQSAISLKHKARGISLDVGLAGERAYGLGARLHGMVFWIKPAGR